MNHRVALVAVTAVGAALAAPGMAAAQLPAPPSLPPGSSADPVTGVVTTVTGIVLGVLDPVTGQLVPAPAAPPPPPEDPQAQGAGGAGNPPAAPPAAGAPVKGTAPISAKDSTAPRLQLRVDRRTEAATARRSGIRVIARCSEDCTATLRVLRGKQVGRKRVTMSKMRTYILRVKLNKRGRAVAARSRTSTKLRVTGRAVDTAGNLSSTVRKTTYVRAAKPARR
ncbi:hypothetical protein [Capillimicrobium parvum]|uniref:DUF5666 domain-containing protein n=1 Tax=Capillimicrobium parvum TaxID=2884022 RepID=A0A9E7BZS2_9ACTN|nr:hypothetical protein [Capillimicrobium parvum]UGS34797.1 hypothetical protein DSM104329_01179 [Capillimicrobium parvum]